MCVRAGGISSSSIGSSQNLLVTGVNWFIVTPTVSLSLSLSLSVTRVTFVVAVITQL